MTGLDETTRRLITEALAEDVGRADWTTLWSVGPDLHATAGILAKAPGVIAGLDPAREVFRAAGDALLEPRVADGDGVEPDDLVATVSGAARAILTGERLALNFLMRLSGVATLTRAFVERIAGTDARITDTRKTTPLWRRLERAATRAGGAVNHRRGLDDMVLIKDNHITCAGSIERAVERVRRSNEPGLEVEVEVGSAEQLEAALRAGVDRILLDNMTPEHVREAVERIRSVSADIRIEASGGVTLERVRAFAEAGVDYISVGALTHSAPALDLSLRLEALDR